MLMHPKDRRLYGAPISVLLAVGLALCLLLTQIGSSRLFAQSIDAAAEPGAGNDAIEQCINDLKAAHIAATAASVVPIPIFSNIADAAEFVISLALKDCAPVVTPPADKVFTPPPGQCAVTVRLPLTRESLQQILVDRDIINDVLNDPALNLPPAIRDELRKALEGQFGRFENQLYGAYSNIYGIPFSSPTYGADWGAIGKPELYHYNADAQIVLTFPGKRINSNEVQIEVGAYTLSWTGDTLISPGDFVYIPDLTNLGPLAKKAAKEGWIKAIKLSIKEAVKEIQEKGVAAFTKKMAKEAAENIATKAFSELQEISKEQLMALTLNMYYADGELHGATNRQLSRLYVIDRNAPTFRGVNPVTVEALEPGGVSAGKHLTALRNGFTVSDDCVANPNVTSFTPSFWPLGATNIITWTASDRGAKDGNGGKNQTIVTQQVQVVDTKPPILVAPPPVIVEANNLVNVAIGLPQVFDVADLRPTISNNAPAQFSLGVHRIDWTATDASGNVSAATKDTQQIVNIKAPGTNNLPTAFPQTGSNTVQAIADEPIKITVRGQDGDPTPDPLWFSIEKQPRNGFFIAPLYPYFINDYRMTARYSPWIAARKGEAVAWQVAQNQQTMRNYIIGLCQENIHRTDLPNDFVSGMDYFAVDEQGYTYIYDAFYHRCTPGGSTIAPYTRPRISVWDQAGNFVGQQERDSSGHPLHSVKFNVARGTIISVQSDGSSTGTSTVDISRIQPENTAQPVEQVQFYGLHNRINNINVGAAQTSRRPEYKNARAAVLDNERGILYLIGTHNLTGLAAFKTAPCDGRPQDGPEACLDLLGVQIYAIDIVQSTKWAEFPGVGVDAMRLQQINDIALDSKGAVYISANNGRGWSRIYKFAEPTIAPDGAITLGGLVGWMGKCDSGPNCDYVHQRSIGFLCTDATCSLDDPSQETGDRPGQFDGIASLAFDRNDVLYVGDGGNKRVQRFSSDGFFAGEARSTGDGSGFVLGDFAGVGNIAVNSHSFYIIDTFREIVHVFDAAVIHGIDEASAWVEYQSTPNYVGSDSFDFAATDGFRNADGETINSAPATVAINVSRNHRPPIATEGLMATTPEDTPVAITLAGQDLDNFGVQRDTLTYQIVSQPQDGQLSGSGANLTYTPDANFNGTERFRFTVSDGSFTSAPAEVVVTVTPVNDVPTITPKAASLRAGVGFPVTFEATVLDPESDDPHTIRIDWGDGTVEENGVIQNNGLLSGPMVSAGNGISRTVVANHTYNSAGSYTLRATVTDGAGAKGETTVPVSVEAMADLAITRNGSTVLSPNRPTIAYDLVVTNRPPSNGGGISAGNVTVKETLGAGLRYQLAASDSGNCTASGTQLNCSIGALAVGASNKIRVVITSDGGLNVGTEIENNAAVAASEADPIPDNNTVGARITLLPAADFLVDGFEEGTDLNPGDGICATGNGVCTLRAAVMEANVLPGKQIIALPRSVVMLNVYPSTGIAPTVEPAPEDDALKGDLDIKGDTEIIGLGASETVLHANNQDRVLHVHNGATVTLRAVGLTGGKSINLEPGGGLRNSGGAVTLQRVDVNSNYAGEGGGIANSSGNLRIVDSSITGNSTVEGGGGGISNEGMLVLENVTISGNVAGSGGGILAQGGNATLTNVTVANNEASGAGGGFNSAPQAITMNNTILAGNVAAFGPNCGYGLTSGGHNLIGELKDCTILGETGSNRIVDDAKLDVLSANVQQTWSQMPLGDSRAIDAGQCVLPTDQNGLARPQGNGCDIGAVEYVAQEAIVIVVRRTLYLPVVAR
jgi:hypothetical protein